MTFVPADKVAEIAIKYDVIGEENINTLCFKRDAGWSISTLNDLALNVIEWVHTSLLPYMSHQARLVSVHTRDLTTANGLVGDVPAPSGYVGLVNQNAVPLNASCAITFRTGLAGRSYRGRNYIIGIPVNEVADSRVSNAYLNGITTAYQDLAAAVQPDAAYHVIVSRYSGYTIVNGKKKPTPRAAAIVTPVIQHYFVDNVMDSQRRRLPGRGR